MKKNLTMGLLLIFCITLISSLGYARNNQNVWMGLSTQTVDDELAEAFNLKVNYGVVVNEVYKDSPADEAGILEGDVIIAFDSEKIFDYDDLIDHLEDSSPDETITLSVMRRSNKISVDVTLGEISRKSYRQFGNNRKIIHLNSHPWVPAIPSIPSLPSIQSIDAIKDISDSYGSYYKYSYDKSTYIGVHLSDLTDQLRDYFSIEENRGVLVSEVEEDSPAEKAGIKAGDIIIEADNQDIYDYRDLKELIEDKKEGEILSITLMRDKTKKQLDVIIAERDDTNNIIFNAPDISFKLPHGKNHTRSNLNTFFSDDLNSYFDSDNFQDEIEQLKEELKQLKFELNNEKYETFDSQAFKKEIEKLKREIKDEEVSSNKELQVELKNLKKEFKELEKRIDD